MSARGPVYFPTDLPRPVPSMKSLLFLPLLAGLLSAKALFKCGYGVQIRWEWRKLEDSEKLKYINALRRVMKRPNASTPSFYDKLVKQHLDAVRSVHGYSPFFPWHRYMLATLEQELQRAVRVTLPYWDWVYDSQAPETAPIWGKGPLEFGGNGDAKTDCVTDGAFAGYTTFYPDKHCLKRKWTERTTIGAFLDMTSVQTHIANSKVYDTYAKAIEGAHGSVHVEIGGDMLDPMTSPNDPVFYLHHTNVDRLWWRWQAANPSLANTYGGVSLGTNMVQKAAAKSDMLPPYNVMVSDVFKTEDLCYRYVKENLNVVKPVLPAPVILNGQAPQQKILMDAPIPKIAMGAMPPPVTKLADDTPSQDTVKTEDTLKEDAPMPKFASDQQQPSVKQIAPKLILLKPDPTKPETVAPSSTDRSDLTKIRIPKPLPEAWLKANNMNVDEARAREEKVADAIIEQNGKTDTPAEGALWTRPGVLAKLVESGDKTFHADVDGLRVEVKPTNDQPLQAVADMKELVKETFKQEGKDVELTQAK